MRFIKPLAVAVLAIVLASPVLAQTDPHHPEGDVTPPAEAGVPATGMAQPAAPTPANAAMQCPDMMGMMRGGGTLMPMMQMHMMAMMQSMQMMQMQQMQGGGMMQPGADGSPQMQMMEMMRSTQMMQMDLMRMMQQMQQGMAAPEGSTEGAKP